MWRRRYSRALKFLKLFRQPGPPHTSWSVTTGRLVKGQHNTSSTLGVGQGQGVLRRDRRWIDLWRPAVAVAAAGKGGGHVVDEQTKARERVRVIVERARSTCSGQGLDVGEAHAVDGRKGCQVHRVETSPGCGESIPGITLLSRVHPHTIRLPD